MPPRMRARPHLLLCSLIAFVACSEGSATPDGSAPTTGNAQPAGPQQQPVTLPTLSHEFGAVRHGETRQHDFVLDVRAIAGPGWYSPGTHVDCSCARTELFLRGRDDALQPIPVFQPDTAPKDGEVLVVRVILDTQKREAVDTKDIDSRVLVVLQRADSNDPQRRVMWPLQFRFRIDAPIRVRPVATFDFERVPPARPKTVALNLSSDLEGRAVKFSNAGCDDPRVQLRIEAQDGYTLLHATLTPRKGDTGSLRTIVTVDTDLDPAYQLRIPAVAAFVPDLEAIPLPKISIHADLTNPQDEGREGSQYVLVTDHDLSRPEDFVVAKITDAAGRDASRLWSITFEKVPGEPRSCRVHARWTGSQPSEFRGELLLAKDAQKGPFLPVELVALHDKNP